MTKEPETFSLEDFETAAYARQHEVAVRELGKLLDLLNRNYGALQNFFSAQVSTFIGRNEIDSHIATRISSAITCLFSDPGFVLTRLGYQNLISLQRWVGVIFAGSSFRNTDHIIRLLNLDGASSTQLKLDDRTVLKFCLLYSPESEIPIDLNRLWEYDKIVTASLAFVLLSPRFLGSPAAHSKREVILKWLPPRLKEIDDLSFLPAGVLHDVYMQCSYADLPERHAIKEPINRLLRTKLHQLNVRDLDTSTPRKLVNGKPVMMVVLEWFTSVHSIYRTHSLSMEACKEKFHLVGVGVDDLGTVDKKGREIFDEFYEVPRASPIAAVARIRELAEQFRASAIYMPSVGMFPLTMFATNLRLAPLQLVALGHPATTRSPLVDFIVVEDDYVGDPACFSEKLLRLPKDGMPYRPSAAYVQREPVLREKPEVISIAVASSLMKINPRFLDACLEISKRSAVPVEFHFLLGFGHGFVFIRARNLIQSYLPDAKIYPHQPYEKYMETIGKCDMYINPFPFGNTNGIVDMTHHGLVGVCKSGPEVFEQIDVAMFRRMGLPESLIAETVEEYVNAAVSLANDHERRLAMRRELVRADAVQRLFKGEPRHLGQMAFALLDGNVTFEPAAGIPSAKPEKRRGK